uniref:Uncharacterized protein n=1 Tax=Anopheles atroparvus TaxID=41427 RepID=A0A8W7N5A7_ANOAO
MSADDLRKSRSVKLKYLATLQQIGRPLEEPIVGRHFRLPERARPGEHPVFDMSLLYIPIYCHLVLHPPEDIARPPTPELITRARMEKAVENWMD